jgi:lipopolysaccharide export system protein LptA
MMSFWRPCVPLTRLRSIAAFPLALTIAICLNGVALVTSNGEATAQAQPSLSDPATSASRALTMRSDVQEANSKTGVVTARGNVQINYPARQIQATSAQAQYFSRERRIVLSGNVYVLQQGNSMRGETITYLMDEGRFVALPEASKQVESIYLVPDNNPPTPTPTASPFGTQPEFGQPAGKF